MPTLKRAPARPLIALPALPGLTAVPALLATLVLAVAACGPAAGPTDAPGGTAPATATPPPTEAPTATDGPTASDPLGLPSFALPSFSSDTDLEALLPDEIAGQPVQKFSMTGDSFLGTGGIGTDELDAVLDQYNKSASDLSVAFAGTDEVTLIAYRIKGVPAITFYPAFEAAARAEADIEVSDVRLGGRTVRKIVSSDPDTGTVYVHIAGDVLFIIGAEDGTAQAVLDEAISKLP